MGKDAKDGPSPAVIFEAIGAGFQGVGLGLSGAGQALGADSDPPEGEITLPDGTRVKIGGSSDDGKILGLPQEVVLIGVLGIGGFALARAMR